jgi:flagellar FliL protein
MRPRLSYRVIGRRRPRLRPQITGRVMAAKAKEAEASDDAAAAGEPAGAKKKLPLKLIIMAAAAVLVIGGGGTAAFLVLGGKKHEEEKHAEAMVKPVAFVDLPDVVVNLASSGGDHAQYLKVKIVLEVADQIIANQIQPLMPRVVDAFQTYLRELRSTDLEGSGGLYRLRDELTRRVNVAVTPNRINAVLFKEIIVQ